MNTKNKKFTTLLALVVVFSMLMAAVPAGTVHAAGSAFDGGAWSTPAPVGVGGRPVVIYDNGIYHMWYGSNDGTNKLYHTTSGNPASFPAGTLATFPDASEVNSPAIALEGTTFYMVKYSAGSTQKFSLYTSPVTDGVNWTFVGEVFDGTSLGGIAKIDAPFLFVNGSGIKLYFQTKTSDATPIYKIYRAGTTAATLAGLGTAPFTNAAEVLAPSTSGWDDFRVFQPWVVLDGTTYHMWYGGYSTSNGTMKIGYATSTDGAAWAKSTTNPIIADGAEPSVVKVGNTWHFWYMGAANAVQHMTLVEYPQNIEAQVVSLKSIYHPGDTFQVNIITTAPYLYGVDLHLTYDATKLTAGKVTTLLAGNYTQKTAASGAIDFAYTQLSDTAIVAPNNVLATIEFTVNANVSGDAVFGSVSALFAGNDGFALPGTPTYTLPTIKIAPYTEVRGFVALQGRTNYAGTTVSLTGQTPVVTNLGAQYEFTKLEAGTYGLTMHKDGYLNASATKILGAQSYIVPTVMLLGGDANNDGAISVLDLGAIGTDYLTAGNVSNTTDINGDGTVNILDLTMAGVNYEKTAQTIAW